MPDRTEEDKIKGLDIKDYLEGKFDYDHVWLYQDAEYVMGIALDAGYKAGVSSQQEKIEELEKQIETSYNDGMKFMKSLNDPVIKEYESSLHYDLREIKDFKNQLSENDKQIEALEQELIHSRCCGNCDNENEHKWVNIGGVFTTLCGKCKYNKRYHNEKSNWKPRS